MREPKKLVRLMHQLERGEDELERMAGGLAKAPFELQRSRLKLRAIVFEVRERVLERLGHAPDDEIDRLVRRWLQVMEPVIKDLRRCLDTLDAGLRATESLADVTTSVYESDVRQMEIEKVLRGLLKTPAA